MAAKQSNEESRHLLSWAAKAFAPQLTELYLGGLRVITFGKRIAVARHPFTEQNPQYVQAAQGDGHHQHTDRVRWREEHRQDEDDEDSDSPFADK